MPEPRRSTIDAGEVERFSALAAEWWNPNGKFRPLHKFNPVRLSYIRDQIAARFGRDPRAARPFEGLRILDIGCGGGLLCEPMARLGAEVVGADASETNIEVAKLHAAEGNVSVDYRATTAEDLADAGETFDVILNMWSDFREESFARKNFTLLPLPQLQEEVFENARRKHSKYDVIAVNMAVPKAAAIASWPSDRWLVPLTRFCRNRSWARFSQSLIST